MDPKVAAALKPGKKPGGSSAPGLVPSSVETSTDSPKISVNSEEFISTIENVVEKMLSPLQVEQASFKKSTDEKLDSLQSLMKDFMSVIDTLQKSFNELSSSVKVEEELEEKSSSLKIIPEHSVPPSFGVPSAPPLSSSVDPVTGIHSSLSAFSSDFKKQVQESIPLSAPPVITSQLSSSSVKDDIDRTGGKEVPKPKKPPDGAFTQSAAGSSKLDDWITESIDLIKSNVEFRPFLKPIKQLWEYTCGLNPNLYKSKRFGRIMDHIVSQSANLFTNVVSVLPDTNQQAALIYMKTNDEYKFSSLFSCIDELTGQVDLSFYKSDCSYVFGLFVYLRQQAGVDVQLRAKQSLTKLTNFRFHPNSKFADQLTHFQTVLNKTILDHEEAGRPLNYSDNYKKSMLIQAMEYNRDRPGFSNVLLSFTQSVCRDESDKSSFLSFCDLLKRTLGSTPDTSKAANSSKKSSDEKSASSSNPVGAVGSQNNSQNKQQGQNSNQGGPNNGNKKRRNRWKNKKNGGNNQNSNNSGQSQAQSNSSAFKQSEGKDNSSKPSNSPPPPAGLPIGDKWLTFSFLAWQIHSTPENQINSSSADSILQQPTLTRDDLMLDSGAACNVGVGPDVMLQDSVNRMVPIQLTNFNGGTVNVNHYGSMKIDSRIKVDNTLVCPQAKFNIMSVSAITSKGDTIVVFSRNRGLVIPVNALPPNVLATLFEKDRSLLVFDRKNRVYVRKVPMEENKINPMKFERTDRRLGGYNTYYPSQENSTSFDRSVQRAREEEKKSDSSGAQNSAQRLRIPKLPQPAQSSQGSTSIVPRVPFVQGQKRDFQSSSSSSSPPSASSSSSAVPTASTTFSPQSDTQEVNYAGQQSDDQADSSSLPYLDQLDDFGMDFPFDPNFTVNSLVLSPSTSLSPETSTSLVSSSSSAVETRDVGIQADRRLESQTWHSRFAHVGLLTMNRINEYYGLNLSKRELVDMCLNCSTCSIAKQRRVNVTNPVRRHLSLPPEVPLDSGPLPPLLTLDEVSADLMGPMSFFDGEQLKLPSINGNNYVLVMRFFNRSSGMKFIIVRCLKTKEASEVVPLFISLIELMEKQTNCYLLNFHSDGGGEFVNKLSQDYFVSRGIRQTITPPMTPALNPAERENYSLIILTRCMLVESGASPYLWDVCINFASYILERIPLLVHSQLITPLEYFFKAKPGVKLIHTFGSNCQVMDVQPSNRAGKFQSSGFPAVFVGVNPVHSCPLTLCIDVRSPRYLSLCSLRDVKYEEGLFTNLEGINLACQKRAEFIAGKSPDDQYEVEKILDFDEQKNSFLVKWKRYALTTWEPRAHLKNCSSLVKDFLSSNYKKKARTPRVIHPVSSSLSSVVVSHINSSVGIEGISLFYANSLLVASATIDVTDEYGDLTPGSFNSAKRSSKWSQWKKAIDEELNGLSVLGTFEEVSVPPRTHVLGTRWVFKLKRDKNNEIIRYKARLVVKGFQQIFGLEFNETYSPTPKMKCLKILLSLAAINDWEIFQLDFENAFVHADLEERVFIHIPQGYELKNSSLVNPALRLVKSLYGLKQAPRSWYLALHNFLEQHQFKRITSDHCVWSFTHSLSDGSSSLIILCTYVDDTLAFVPSPLISIWLEFKSLLATHFRIKDLGDSKWILNMEIVRDRVNGTVSMDQQAYVSTVVARFPVESSRQPPSTPYWKEDITSVPVGCDSTPLSPSNHSRYRSIVGCLLYAANISRIDISHIVNVLCRYMHAPLHFHLQAAEYVLRFLAPRTSFPLLLGRSASSAVAQSSRTQSILGLELVLWSDSDFGNESGGVLGEKRHSISGLLVTANNHAAWWTSTKQSQLAQSSTEAELYALNNAARESKFIHYFLRDLFDVNFVPVVMADNNGSALISDHNTSHARTKHIDIRGLYIRELMQNKEIILQLVSTAQQLADILTKSFPPSKKARYYQLLSLLGFNPAALYPP